MDLWRRKTIQSSSYIHQVLPFARISADYDEVIDRSSSLIVTHSWDYDIIRVSQVVFSSLLLVHDDNNDNQITSLCIILMKFSVDL